MPITETVDVPAHLLIPRQREQDPSAGPSRPVLREHIDAMIDLHPGGLIWRRTFPGTPDRIPHARHFTRYLLADAPCQDDAEQIVAELAANALRHTSSGRSDGTFIVEITRTTATTTVAVYDCGWGGRPRFGADFRTDAECGRGLALVAALADEVGCEGDEEVGHKVWATIHTRPDL
ncbi:ATP-binding protein [Nonomuraea sp. NEAU-A123]|uniref:ATP-binding protein n=1 Tax=Nonomuraea sp. NEAU-A123 TaxID=2839649 RepID=UPI001BE4A7A9|nr:ATP-binding protein [Nonomuraea sp. NEAU-A123]MBT2230447.1 ATP-binding protein [Nonomuraea sp. NEAU-A123]